jgi:hypothetical protein
MTAQFNKATSRSRLVTGSQTLAVPKHDNVTVP